MPNRLCIEKIVRRQTGIGRRAAAKEEETSFKYAVSVSWASGGRQVGDRRASGGFLPFHFEDFLVACILVVRRLSPFLLPFLPFCPFSVPLLSRRRAFRFPSVVVQSFLYKDDWAYRFYQFCIFVPRMYLSELTYFPLSPK